jgi:hypothetical protein
VVRISLLLHMDTLPCSPNMAFYSFFITVQSQSRPKLLTAYLHIPAFYLLKTMVHFLELFNHKVGEGAVVS